MTTTPLLTIITICYNAEATIAPTLRSLAEQSDQSFEYLVIDGASQDKTLSLVQTLYPRATVNTMAPTSGISMRATRYAHPTPSAPSAPHSRHTDQTSSMATR